MKYLKMSLAMLWCLIEIIIDIVAFAVVIAVLGLVAFVAATFFSIGYDVFKLLEFVKGLK